MTSGDSTDPTWRATAKGDDSSVRDWLDESREREQVAAATWMEKAAPNSALSIERRGDTGRGDHVVAEISVPAADAEAAERLARSLFDQALPSVTFTEAAAVPDTEDRVQRYPGHCAFCGKSRDEVRKMVAFPGAAICDECVKIATKSMEYEFPAESSHD
jgi:hypothetical protein